MGREFDLVVIGGGLSGITAAELAAKLGMKVALVEKMSLGGNYINYDVPMAAMHEALVESGGQNALRRHPSLMTLRGRAKAAVTKERRSPQKLRDLGINIFNGTAHFIDKTSVAVGNRRLSARHFIIATGSAPRLDLANIESVHTLTPSLALQRGRTPREVIVIGAGAAGCELASLFAAVGSKVTLLDKASRILPDVETEIAKQFATKLSKRYGVRTHTNSQAVALQRQGDRKVVHLSNGRTHAADEIILAMGATPQLDLELHNAGIKVVRGQITVDENLRTTNKKVFVIGSCRGGRAGAARSLQEARLAVINIMNRMQKAYMQYSVVDTLLLGDEELAQIGLPESECKRRKLRYQVFVRDSLKLITTGGSGKKNQILGATLLAPNAELILLPIALATRTGISIQELNLPTSALSANYIMQSVIHDILKV
ncbi:NAD(P)/FAD-dependent oxidoreductase [Candidatus Saccharibacteria bacterium]|nr:NAD(P)/FAD-dependent oxidoreductase [Candidatus Saccharibacteria bacterium]